MEEIQTEEEQQLNEIKIQIENAVQSQDLERLFAIRDLKSKLSKEISNLIDYPIHTLGTTMIKENKNFKNELVLEFIMKDRYWDYKTEACLLYIIPAIDLDTIQKQFIVEYSSEKLRKTFGKIYTNFLGGIFEKITDFDKYYEFGQRHSKKEMNKFIKEKFLEKFKSLLCNANNRVPEKCSIVSIWLIEIFDKDKDAYELIFNELERVFVLDRMTGIYISILKSIKDKYMIASKHIIHYFIHKCMKTNSQREILTVIDEMSGDNKIYFYDNFKEFAFDVNDFYSFPISFNFECFEKLLSIDGTTIKNEYMTKSKKVCDELYSNLFRNNFYVQQKIKLEEGDKDLLKRKLLLISLNDTAREKELQDKLENAFNKVNSCFKLLQEAKDFYMFYYSESITMIKGIDNLRTMCERSPIQTLYDKEDRFTQYWIEKNLYNEYNELKKSKFFICLYDFFKKKKLQTTSYHEQALAEFKTFKSLFTQGIESIKNEEIFLEINKIVTNKEMLEREFNFMQNYFKLNSIPPTLIENFLVFANKTKASTLIDQILFFCKVCNVSFTESFGNKLSEYKDEINKAKTSIEAKRLNDKLAQLPIPVKIDSPYFMFLTALNNKKELVEFIFDKKEEDVRSLVEFIDDVDNTFLKVTDVQDLIKVVNFFEQIKSLRAINDINLMQGLLNLCQQNVYKYIDVYVHNVAVNLIALKDLYMSTTNKEEFTKQKIQELIELSKFEITNGVCEIKYGNNKTIKFEDVLELRDRVLLKKKTETQAYSNINDLDEFGNNDQFENDKMTFSKIISSISTVINKSITLQNKGYPFPIKLSIEIIMNVATIDYQDNQSIISIDEMIADLTLKEETLQQIVLKAYKENEVLTFLYGNLFTILTQFLSSNEDKPKHKDIVKFFLRYLTCNKYTDNPMNLQYSYIKTDNKNALSDMILNLSKFLNEFLTRLNYSIELLYAPSKINPASNNKYYGLYTHYVPKNELENSLINIHVLLTRSNNLQPHCILICNDMTTSEELLSFLYRAFYCKTNTLFMIAKSEEMDLEKKKIILDFFEKIYIDNYKEMKSCFMFIYCDKSSDLIQILTRTEGHQSIKETIPHGNFRDDNVHIISSEASGSGKSYTIVNKIAKTQSNCVYLYFPAGGEFTRNDIIKRFKDAIFTFDNQQQQQRRHPLLHLDLMESKRIELMKNFLFNVLVLKCFNQNENIVYLGKESVFCVELPNGFTDFYSVFPFLRNFPSEVIKKESINQLLIPSALDSDIQIVCNYLLHFKTLDKKGKRMIDKFNLYIPGVSVLDQTEVKKKYKKYYIFVKEVPPEQCKQLIKEFFNTDVTFYQINSFINVLADQLKKFTNNIYLEKSFISNLAKARKSTALKTFRSNVITMLIDFTQYFTKGAYDDIIKLQAEAYKSQIAEYDYTEAQLKGVELLAKGINETICFDNINKNIIFFNEDIQSITIVPRCDKESEDYQKLINFYNMNNPNKKELWELPNYALMNSDDFLNRVTHLLNLRRKIKLRTGEYTDIKTILDSYVFTMDNFLKMILVILRLRAKIPVILMGETGCGKTSLIRALSALKRANMKTLNIHAGTTDKHIYEFMRANKALKSSVNPITTTTTAKKDDHTWIFLDEINTCNSMGLIAEMMCKRTIFGEPIADNVTFIAACNPYREFTKQTFDIGLVKDKEKQKRYLVYTVNPLPHSLMNYVFDFGNLLQEDEYRYIESIIHSLMSKYLNSDEKGYKLFVERACKAITIAQNYIREIYDRSSVSLREIRRFSIFFEWFLNYLMEKKNINKSQTIKMQSITHDALNLAIYLCYYIRLPLKQFRLQFKECMCTLFPAFERIPMREARELADKVIAEKGIAKNKSLLENLFTLFVCVNNKVPVFICGKPGCSKSLSMNLLFKAMRGESSDDAMFKKLPRLYINSYQGSLTSTSEGILKIFNKARELLQKQQKDDNFISMVYFDEMGLAEISANNPLKVIHSQLEYDENDDKVAFVGISNWTLDASKMNRGIFLSIPDQDQEDLQTTAVTIASSYDEVLNRNYGDFFNKLADTYFYYKEFLRQSQSTDVEFHGSRDFYHLIKLASRELIYHYNEGITYEGLIQIGRYSLQRNFGGLDYSIPKLEEIFLNSFGMNVQQDYSYDAFNCLQRNIDDKYSRYLLLISKSPITKYVVNNVLLQRQWDYVFRSGSAFYKDLNEESYSVKMLNKVQNCLEQGKVLVLRKLDIIYPSLYDVFNQNFTTVGGKNFARIAFGYSNNLLVNVHDNFRCIILLDEDEVKQQDPPFLNRFEKHILNVDAMLYKDYMHLCGVPGFVLQQFYKLITPANDNMKTTINLRPQLININEEELKGLVYWLGNQNDANIIVQQIVSIIAPILSQDIIAFAKDSLLYVENNEFANLILSEYQNKEVLSLKDYLLSNPQYKSVIYTFSHILTAIEYPYDSSKVEIQNKDKVVLEYKKPKEVLVSSILCENELERELDEYYKNKEYYVLVFKFCLNDCHHLSYIRDIVENYEKEKEIDDKHLKHIIFTVHLPRIISTADYADEVLNSSFIQNPYFLSFLTNYHQHFIDNLNGSSVKISNLIWLSNRELSETTKQDVMLQLPHKVYQALMLIDYQSKNVNTNYKDKTYANYLMDSIKDNSFLYEIIINTVFSHLEKERALITSMLFDSNIFDKLDIDFVGTISKYIKHRSTDFINKLVIQLEKDGVFSSMILSELKDHELIKYNVEQHCARISLNDIKINLGYGSNPVDIIHTLDVPLSKIYFDSILNFVRNIQDQFLANENNIRLTNFTEFADIKGYIDNYIQIQNEIVLSLRTSFENIGIKSFIDYISSNPQNQELTSFLFQDFYKIFLSKQFNCEYPSLLVLLNKITDLRLQSNFNHGGDPFYILAFTILFFESYSKYLYEICSIFNKLDKHIPHFYSQINNLITDKDIEYISSKKNPQQKLFINEAFYLVIEAILYLSVEPKHISFDENNLNSFLYFNLLKELFQQCQALESNLRLYLKQLSPLEIFNEANELFFKLGNDYKMTCKSYINLLDSEKKIKTNEIGALIKSLERHLKFLQTKIGHFKETPNLLMTILVNKYKTIDEDIYRKKIIDVIVSDYHLSMLAPKILRYIFGAYNLSYLYVEPHLLQDESNMIVLDFLGFSRDQSNICLKPLNEAIKTNKVLEDKLLYFFELNITKYFISISEPPVEPIKVIGGSSYYYLDVCVNYIDNIEAKQNADPFWKLGLLYAIAYIKIYMKYFVNFNFNGQVQKEDNVKVNYLLHSKDTKIRQMIRYYYLKVLLHSHLEGNFDLLTKFDWKKHTISWTNQMNLRHDAGTDIDYAYFNLKEIKAYDNMKFIFYQWVNKKINDDMLLNLINGANGNELLIDILLNETICKMFRNDFIVSEIYQTMHSGIYNMLYPKGQLTDEERAKCTIKGDKKLKDYIKRIISNDIFTNNVIKYLHSITKNKIVIYLMAIKYGFIIINSNENSFYGKLYAKNFASVIDSAYVPGSEPDCHTLVESFYQIEDFLRTTNSPSQAAYVCSCNHWYSIEPCGLPSVKSTCMFCRKEIGGTNHYLVDREGHYRVYPNQEHKSNVEGRSYYHPLRSKMLADLEVEVKALEKTQSKGIPSVSTEEYENGGRVRRTMDEITYRVLSFVLYSGLFMNLVSGYIENEQAFQRFSTKEYDNQNGAFNILMITYNALRNALKAKKINSVEVFLNLLYPKLNEYIVHTTSMFTTIKERELFETGCCQVVQEVINNYDAQSKEYLKENERLLQVDVFSPRAIINELYSPLIYNEETHPYMNYFMLNVYPDQINIINDLNKNKNKLNLYPVLCNFLENKDEIDIIRSIALVNPFANSIREEFSYHITRDQAKERTIQQALQHKNSPELNKMFSSFQQGWNLFIDKIDSANLKYKCRGEMEKQYIDLSFPLSYTLNDDGDFGHGMYLAAMYEKCSEYQNKFIHSIIDNPNTKGVGNLFKEQLSKEILPHQATDVEIVSFALENDNNQRTNYDVFYDLLTVYSYRDCYNENGTIDYTNYRTIVYNYQSIEEELSKIILPGKRLFKDEQIFVTYAYEGYRGNKSSVILDFINQFPQRSLTKEELQILKLNINEAISTEYMLSIQMLIFYLNKIQISNKASVAEIIMQLPKYTKIGDNCKAFFINNQNFVLETLIGVFEFVEYLSYREICENVNNDYKKMLTVEEMNTVNDYFNTGNKDRLISKPLLANGLRKFISRSLGGKRADNEIKEDDNLILFLQYKEEIWSKEVFDDDRFMDEMDMMLSFNVQNCKAVKFYNFLGGDGEIYGFVK